MLPLLEMRTFVLVLEYLLKRGRVAEIRSEEFDIECFGQNTPSKLVLSGMWKVV